MSVDHWPRVSELFQAALDREPAARPAFLAAACGSDEALRREVESLLAAHGQAEGFLSAGPAPTPPDLLAPGTRLGRYEILGPLGAGGMAEVYRARDARLDREVAVKVLPRAVARDPDRLRRFEQEARAASRLNHPHVLAVYDVGAEDGRPYIVSELLDGGTLRARLAEGPLPVAKATAYGVQIARGLAAAHAAGIVHRDLKPDNVFVSREGHVKLLDFGLARALGPERPDTTRTEPLTEPTGPGILLGTAGYMAPEQARAEAADTRADLFALGAILFEMLTGQRAFRGTSAADTLTAVLQHDPVARLEALPHVPRELVRLVRHCLEKHADERVQSARDLAFALEPYTGSVAAAAPAVGPRSRPRPGMLLAAAVSLAAVAAAYVLGTRSPAAASPSYRPLTFRRGAVDAARFSPDGNTIYYSAAWDGALPEVFSTRLDGLESRALGLAGATLVATVPGEMALLRQPGDAGALARAPLEGGAPRDVLTGVLAADWNPESRRFAVVRQEGGRVRLEYPPGQVLYETVGRLVTPRVSRDGSRVAVVDQPMLGNTVGALVVVGAAAPPRTLSDGWSDIGGVAWSADSREVWFTATRGGNARSLHAVTLSGAHRLVSRAPAAMILQDVSPRGGVLVTHTHPRCEAIGRLAGDAAERDLSWYDWTHLTDLWPDGRTLFTAEGEGGGPLYTVYLRERPGSIPLRLGEGHGTEISPDGRSALCLVRSSPPRLVILPTGAGDTRTLAHDRRFAEYHWAWWFPDGRRVLFLANEAGRGAQLFVHDIGSGAVRALAPPGVTAYRHRPITPDGRHVLALAPGPPRARFVLWPTEGGTPTEVSALAAGDQPLQWTSDGQGLFVRLPGAGLPVRVERLDLRTGARSPWRELRPADAAGIGHIGDVVLTPDGGSYVYNAPRGLSELYLVDGLR